MRLFVIERVLLFFRNGLEWRSRSLDLSIHQAHLVKRFVNEIHFLDRSYSNLAATKATSI